MQHTRGARWEGWVYSNTVEYTTVSRSDWQYFLIQNTVFIT